MEMLVGNTEKAVSRNSRNQERNFKHLLHAFSSSNKLETSNAPQFLSDIRIKQTKNAASLYVIQHNFTLASFHKAITVHGLVSVVLSCGLNHTQLIILSISILIAINHLLFSFSMAYPRGQF
jgi:hypothetical protein